VVEERHAFGDHDRVTAEAAALVASGVDVIVTFGTPLTVAAIQATKRIPIVFGFVSDPVEKGMITSLARPGGNVTGMAVLIANAKVWQYLREVAPDTVRIGYLVNVLNQPAASRTEAYEALAQARVTANASAVGVEPIKLAVKSLAEIESGFAELEAMGKAGTIVGADGVFIDWRAQIMALALRHRLPTAWQPATVICRGGLPGGRTPRMSSPSCAGLRCRSRRS
jgi:putative ABC transport system substrate-binding protein